MWASGLAGYYFSCLFIPSIGQIICGLSSRGCWQERRPDINAAVKVGVVDEFAVPAVEDACVMRSVLREPQRRHVQLDPSWRECKFPTSGRGVSEPVNEFSSPISDRIV